MLRFTSLRRTLLTVHTSGGGDNDGGEVVLSVEVLGNASSYTVMQLQPSTIYQVAVSFVFEGGGQGSIVQASHSTLHIRQSQCIHTHTYIIHVCIHTYIPEVSRLKNSLAWTP